jgi:hypothetical protein
MCEWTNGGNKRGDRVMRMKQLRFFECLIASFGLALLPSCLPVWDSPTGPGHSNQFSDSVTTVSSHLGGDWVGTISGQPGITDTGVFEFNLSVREYRLWIEGLAKFAGGESTYPRTDSIRVSSTPCVQMFRTLQPYEVVFDSVAGTWYGRLTEGQADTALTGLMGGRLTQEYGATGGSGDFYVAGEALRFYWDVTRISPGG